MQSAVGCLGPGKVSVLLCVVVREGGNVKQMIAAVEGFEERVCDVTTVNTSSPLPRGSATYCLECFQSSIVMKVTKFNLTNCYLWKVKTIYPFTN